MINTKTVFILGAGASHELNYPLGLELVDRVRRTLYSGTEQFAQLLEVGFSEGEINAFVSEMVQSGMLSVDAFLEHRPTHINIGKHAIAQALLPKEHIDSLFPTDRMNWYQYIFNYMNTSFEDFHRNKVSFITFNYDKSLEHFLFTALKNKYGKNDEEAAAKLGGLSIVHVYGSLGKLYWEAAGGRNYGGFLATPVLKEAAKHISIIHEGKDTSKPLDDARAILYEGVRIYFLGFGYHETNLLRLRIHESVTTTAQIMGTTFGLLQAESDKVLDMFSSQFKRPARLFNQSVLDFLRDKAQL